MVTFPEKSGRKSCLKSHLAIGSRRRCEFSVLATVSGCVRWTFAKCGACDVTDRTSREPPAGNPLQPSFLPQQIARRLTAAMCTAQRLPVLVQRTDFDHVADQEPTPAKQTSADPSKQDPDFGTHGCQNPFESRLVPRTKRSRLPWRLRWSQYSAMIAPIATDTLLRTTLHANTAIKAPAIAGSYERTICAGLPRPGKRPWRPPAFSGS